MRFSSYVANQRIKDYILRLKNASLIELGYRAKQYLLVIRLKRLVKKKISPVRIPKIDFLDISSLKLPSFQQDVSGDVVEKIIQGKTFTLNCDPEIIKKFEEETRNKFFSDIKLSKLSGSSIDIRQVWEPGRLQHISILIAHLIQNPKSRLNNPAHQFVKEDLLKWIDENPFLYGSHYMSAMECGLRIPVFFYSLKLIDDFSKSEYRLILNAIFQHAWWISKRLSLHSSLGNHTICESVGLIFAGAVFRSTAEGKKWLKKGVDLLKSELMHQISDDGGPAEQSSSYHRFVLDLYWLSIDFMEKNDLYDCSDIKPRLMLGEEFLHTFQDGNGKTAAFGDCDDGCAVAPGLSPVKFKTGHIKPGFKVFRHSGYTVLRTESGVFFALNHSPLGMPPLYNHGHADALSITLSKDGKEILIDPGTYRYNTEPEYRKYFKGTRAHNTVTVDRLDQAVQESSFIWSHPYKTDLLSISEQNDRFFIKAVHDGYSRLKEPVRHKRSIFFFDKTNFLIKDTFSGQGSHDFELIFHFHPDVLLSKTNGWWLIDNNGVKVFMRLLGERDFLLLKGQTDPLLGWYSPAYGLKIKSSVLSSIKRGPANEISFSTLICTELPYKD